MGKNCPDPQRAIGVLQRRRVPLRKGERQRIGGAVYTVALHEILAHPPCAKLRVFVRYLHCETRCRASQNAGLVLKRTECPTAAAGLICIPFNNNRARQR